MKTVLVVDDNENLLRSVTMALRKQYTVLCAQDIATARNLFQENDVDVVVMDIVFPEREGGVDLARSFREIRKVPTLAISGYVTGLVMDLLPSVFDGYLQKPFTASELRQAINDVQDIFQFGRGGETQDPTSQAET